MDTVSTPPAKKICYNKEYLNTETSKHVVRPFKLTQQFPSRIISNNNDGIYKLLKFKSVDGKDLGEFKVKMINKNVLQLGKAIMVTKQLPKPSEGEQNIQGISQQKESEIEDPLLKRQSQYTTKAQYLPELDAKFLPTPREKLIMKPNTHRPLILKKNVKPFNKPQPISNPKVQVIKIAKPISNEVVSLNPGSSISEKVPVNYLPEQGKVIKSYTRTLKKIGPNMQLLPHDSPDAKTIINTLTEPVNGRNGIIKYLQKPIQNTIIGVNGFPLKLDQIQGNGNDSNKDISQNLTIIEQALSSLDNSQLREKALQALEECKTTNERKVPIKPPLEEKSLSDSLVQTDVFSLMVPGEFVITSNNCTEIKSQTVQEKLISESNKNENSSNNKSKFKMDFDEILKTFGKENRYIEKILERKKLDVPDRILKQLYADYKSMKAFDEDGLLGIHRAVVSNNITEVKRFLLMIKMMKTTFGFDVNAKTLEGNTCLELAIECNVSNEIVTELLEAGVKPTTNDSTHNSAISIAIKKGLPCFTQLIKYVEKSALDATDSHGFTCLHYCAQKGDVDNAKLLLLRGANVDAVDDKSGRTALFIAVENNFEELTKLLLQFNADPRIPNFAGQTILH